MTVKQTMEAVHISALTQEAQSSVAVGLDIDWPQIAGVVMVRSYYIAISKYCYKLLVHHILTVCLQIHGCFHL